MYHVYMKSKWSHLKPEAIRLRKSGRSLPYIHKKLQVPKSTLSYWFKNIQLTKRQKERLRKNWENGLVKARKKAAKWHNEQKTLRMKKAAEQARETLDKLQESENEVKEIALAFLYLGEGTKAKEETGMGSSDPQILKFFISCLIEIYAVPVADIRCELHLRADQNGQKMITYWSKKLGVPKDNFYKPHHDKRTAGTSTYATYKGVCLVRCGRVAIQRKLVYIARHYCNDVIASRRD